MNQVFAMENFKKMIVFSNWKIYMRTRAEVNDYIKILKNELRSFNNDLIEVYIMTDFTSFEVVNNNLKCIHIGVGVQDVFWEDYGPYAGEVSPLMLKDIECKCVYMGHSERKIYFNENNENINKKVLACYRNGMMPFLFVGETKEEFEKGYTEKVLKEQLKAGLSGIPAEFMKNLALVYEPRWVIGKKDAASPDIIERCHYKVRELISDLYNTKTAEVTRILYGGSVNLKNIEAIIGIPQVDGAGSTRSSLNPKTFTKMVRLVEKEAENRVLTVA